MDERERSSTYFISHAPDQRVLANAVENLLKRREGAVSILYEWDFSTEEDFVREISDALVDADAVICLVSPDFMSSLWCVKEFAAAQKAQKLIPIFTEKCNTDKLPQVADFINLVGLGQKDQFAKLESELNPLVSNLIPHPMNYDETFEFVERVPIVLPLFEGADGHDAEIFQRHAAQFLDSIMSEHNIQISIIPYIVGTKEEATRILDSALADIVLCGRFTADRHIEVGFSTTRGWKLKEESVLPEPAFDLAFKTRVGVLGDLASVLKFALGNLEIARKRTDKAEKCFFDAIRGVDSEKAYIMGVSYMYAFLGYMYILEGQWDRALWSYTEALKCDPNSSLSYNNRGHIYYKFGQFDLAMRDFNQAIAVDPKCFYSYQNRGDLYCALGQPDEAIKDYNQALDLNPKLTYAYNNLGNIYRDRGQFDQALAVFDRAIDLDPKYALAYANRSTVYIDNNQFDQALKDLNQAISLDPTSDFAYDERGYVYCKLGLFDKSLEDVSQVIKLNPTYYRAYLKRSEVYVGLGAYDKAIEDAEKYILLSGDNNPKILFAISEFKSKLFSGS